MPCGDWLSEYYTSHCFSPARSMTASIGAFPVGKPCSVTFNCCASFNALSRACESTFCAVMFKLAMKSPLWVYLDCRRVTLCNPFPHSLTLHKEYTMPIHGCQGKYVTVLPNLLTLRRSSWASANVSLLPSP